MLTRTSFFSSIPRIKQRDASGKENSQKVIPLEMLSPPRKETRGNICISFEFTGGDYPTQFKITFKY